MIMIMIIKNYDVDHDDGFGDDGHVPSQDVHDYLVMMIMMMVVVVINDEKQAYCIC